MSNYERQYLNLGEDIFANGDWVENTRTGTQCLTLIGATMKFDGNHIPLLNTKQSFPVSA